MSKWTRETKLETAFITVFSALIIVLFYSLISMNGLVLGNDPAVHLAKAQLFLKTGQIPLSSVGWIPPLFEIVLATIISFTGASNAGELIFLVKALAVIINWLLFISVYVVGSKFFNKKVGAVSAVFLAMCYPVYELNTWGGYTTVLGMAFLLLLSYYSYLTTKHFAYTVVTFFVAFAIVLSHQITTFLTVVIMFPVLFLMLLKFKGAYLKGFIAIMVGGAIAFFAYYFHAIASYFDAAIYHIFFGNKAYILQVPYTNFQSFLLYYGFTQFLAIGGIIVSYYLLKQQKKLILFATLLLILFVPFFFAESYVFGFLLPFQWFTYYLTPPIAILAAVFVVFMAEKLSVYFTKNRHFLNKPWLKVASIALIVIACCPIIGFHVYNTQKEVMIAADFNTTSDINAYEAADWLTQNYPGDATVVVTKNPGDWFAIFSGKHVIPQTHDWEGRNAIADSVLNLDYEIEGPQTLVKTYETNHEHSFYEKYVSLEQIWYQVSYSSLTKNFLSFNQNGTNYRFALSELNRTTSFGNQNNPKTLELRYFNGQVELTQTVTVQNDSYAITVSWSISALNGDISDVSLYLVTYFDLQFQFDKAQIPQLMDWVNPWDVPSKKANGAEWATVTFSGADLTESYVGFYDTQNQTAFAFYFTDLPEWGNIGALGNHQIDAVRYQYDFKIVGVNQTVTRQYKVLTLTQNSYPTLQPDELQSLFNIKFDPFPVAVHDYKSYIAEYNIGFIVYDKNQFDRHASLPLGSSFLPLLAQCQFLELVYSNSRYDVFKILGN